MYCRCSRVRCRWLRRLGARGSEQAIGNGEAPVPRGRETRDRGGRVQALDPRAAARGRGGRAHDGAGDAAVEIRILKKREQVGPFEDLEVIRQDAGMPTARFMQLIGVPNGRIAVGRPKRSRTARRRAHRAATIAVRGAVVRHASAHPAWGHRKIWAMARHDGHRVSQATIWVCATGPDLLRRGCAQRERRARRAAQGSIREETGRRTRSGSSTSRSTKPRPVTSPVAACRWLQYKSTRTCLRLRTCAMPSRPCRKRSR